MHNLPGCQTLIGGKNWGGGGGPYISLNNEAFTSFRHEMSEGVQQIKLDATSLRSENERVTVVLNFNIPTSVVEEDEPVTFLEVLNNIATYLSHNFDTQQLVFQVTAAYYLSNKKNGNRQLWTGSFYPVGNHTSCLSGPVFQAFRNSESFVQRVIRYSSPQNVVDCLGWGGEDSDWTFDSLASIIVSVQTQLRENHSYLRNNGLLDIRGGHQRRIITKIYPF